MHSREDRYGHFGLHRPLFHLAEDERRARKTAHGSLKASSPNQATRSLDNISHANKLIGGVHSRCSFEGFKCIKAGNHYRNAESIMPNVNYISTHSGQPAIGRPAGIIDPSLLGDAWRSMLRLMRSTNAPWLREIEYDEGYDSIFRFSNVGREVFVTLRNDNYISRSLAAVGAYDFEAFETAARILGAPLAALVDIGANLGSICIPAVARGYAARAIAIEPDELNFRTLMANIYLNGLQDRLFAINSALGAEPETFLEFQISPNNKGDHRVCVSDTPGAFGEEGWSRLRVPSTNLDSLIKAHHLLDRPAGTLIWMDVQGWESRVLAGATGLLAHSLPFVIEFWPYGLRRNGLLDEMLDRITFHFETIHVISWPGAPQLSATRENIGQILDRLDPTNALSACDLLLTGKGMQ